jgi:hypothetical protein
MRPGKPLLRTGYIELREMKCRASAATNGWVACPGRVSTNALPAARARQCRQLDDDALARGWQERVGRSRRRISMCQKRVLITPTKRGCGRAQSAMGQTTCKCDHVTAASLGSYITVTQLLDSRTRPSNASSSRQHAVAAHAPACDWLPWVIHCDGVIVS